MFKMLNLAYEAKQKQLIGIPDETPVLPSPEHTPYLPPVFKSYP